MDSQASDFPPTPGGWMQAPWVPQWLSLEVVKSKKRCRKEMNDPCFLQCPGFPSRYLGLGKMSPPYPWDKGPAVEVSGEKGPGQVQQGEASNLG